MVDVTISGSFLDQCQKLYLEDLKKLKEKDRKLEGINGYAGNALSVYILSLAAFESFFNELMFTEIVKTRFSESSLWRLGADWVEKLPMNKKVILIPQMLFNDTYKIDEQPYQDFSLLLKMRNAIIHYKMESSPSFIDEIEQRGLGLPPEEFGVVFVPGSGYPWPESISSLEGVRWAINTVGFMAKKLDGIIKNSGDIFIPVMSLVENFNIIEPLDVKKFLEGID